MGLLDKAILKLFYLLVCWIIPVALLLSGSANSWSSILMLEILWKKHFWSGSLWFDMTETSRCYDFFLYRYNICVIWITHSTDLSAVLFRNKSEWVAMAYLDGGLMSSRDLWEILHSFCVEEKNRHSPFRITDMVSLFCGLFYSLSMGLCNPRREGSFPGFGIRTIIASLIEAGDPSPPPPKTPAAIGEVGRPCTVCRIHPVIHQIPVPYC